MKKSLLAKVSATSALLALGFSGGAQADMTFLLNNSNCPIVSGDASCTNGGVTATMSAYGSTTFAPSTGASNFVKYSLSGGGATGFGANTPGETASPIDSSAPGSSIELVLLSFSQLVYLRGFTLVTDNGAAANSDNYSLYRWNGVGTPNLTTTLAAQNSNTISGWTLVKAGDASADATSTTTPGAGATGYGIDTSAADLVGSDWWLISTYVGTSFTAGDDAFRIERVTAALCASGPCDATNNVAEPGSLALLGLALAGAAGIRRRREKRLC